MSAAAAAAAASELRLYVDTREHEVRAALPEASVVNLHVGDLLIVQPLANAAAAASREAFADAPDFEPLYVVERKRLSDLAASITEKKDQAAVQRWSDQKRRCAAYCAKSRHCVPILGRGLPPPKPPLPMPPLTHAQ